MSCLCFALVMFSRRDYSCLDCLVFDQNYNTLDDFFLGCVVDIECLSAFALKGIVVKKIIVEAGMDIRASK